MSNEDDMRFRKSSLSFANRLDDFGDHVIFLISFIFGVVPLAVCRLLFDIPAEYISCWLIFILLSYAFIIYITNRFRLREDRAADNLYFLGFLFTVAALLVSLYKFSQVTDESTLSNNPLTVVGDLGIGLITTLIGLFLRVLFTQMRTDPDEIEERIRLKLTDAVEVTRDKILDTLSLVEEAQILIKQILLESQERLIEFNKTFETSILQLSQKIQSIDIPSDMITSKLDPPLGSAEKSLQNFSDKTSKIEVPSNLLTTQVTSASRDIIRSFASSFEKELNLVGGNAREKLAQEAKKIGQEAAVLIGNLEVPPDLIEKKISPLVDDLAHQFSEASTGLISTTKTYLSEVKKSTQTLTGIQEELNDSTDPLKEKLSSSLKNISDDMDAIGLEFFESIKVASKNISGASDVYKTNAINAFNNFDAQLKAPVESVSNSAKKIEESFAALNEATSNALVNIKKLSEALKELDSPIEKTD